MATSDTKVKAKQTVAAGDASSHSRLPFFRKSHDDDLLAYSKQPELYWRIKYECASFNEIVKAWAIRSSGKGPKKSARSAREDDHVSRFLEGLARKNFSDDHKGIQKVYLSSSPLGGCALTGDNCIHGVMNSNNPELILYADEVLKLCRDAQRTFRIADQKDPEHAGGRTFKPIQWIKAQRKASADKNLRDIGEILYSVLSRAIFAASIIEDKRKSQPEKEDAITAVRVEWENARSVVSGMIQRQARLEYFVGVAIGALASIPALAYAGWLAAHLGTGYFNEPGETGSFAAAIIAGAVGAVISVARRMATDSLVIDFTASKTLKILLGILRPVVGAVFGAVVYFAIVAGLLGVQANTHHDPSIALAFFAIAGFAAGFSERFATDVLERASSSISPAAEDKPGSEKTDELSLPR